MLDILCANTLERVALLGGQLRDNALKKAPLNLIKIEVESKKISSINIYV